MLRTCQRSASVGSRSTFTLPNATRSTNCFATPSTIGENVRHGRHHPAHRSTATRSFSSMNLVAERPDRGVTRPRALGTWETVDSAGA